MGDLDPDFGAVGVNPVDDPGESRNVLVRPKPQVGIRNASVRFHIRHFHDDQANPADRPAEIMDVMPFVRLAVLGGDGVLHHGRHDDAVFELQSFHAKRGKQMPLQIGHLRFGVAGCFIYPNDPKRGKMKHNRIWLHFTAGLPGQEEPQLYCHHRFCLCQSHDRRYCCCQYQFEGRPPS